MIESLIRVTVAGGTGLVLLEPDRALPRVPNGWPGLTLFPTRNGLADFLAAGDVLTDVEPDDVRYGELDGDLNLEAELATLDQTLW